VKRAGIADRPLHGGKAPRWLYQRMKRLAQQLIIAIVQEFGARELLHRLSDPYWFQAPGSVLAFDWYSSGLTTTVCGAMKEGVKGLEQDLALLSELIYRADVSFRHPARFSFADGGKDGHPYPVDRPSYDRSIEILKQAVERTGIGDGKKMEAIKRLDRFDFLRIYQR
jgi:hypothetical protein